jgi:hypothetical protein
VDRGSDQQQKRREERAIEGRDEEVKIICDSSLIWWAK